MYTCSTFYYKHLIRFFFFASLVGWLCALTGAHTEAEQKELLGAFFRKHLWGRQEPPGLAKHPESEIHRRGFGGETAEFQMTSFSIYINHTWVVLSDDHS